MLYLYKVTKNVSHNLFHWTLPLSRKIGTTASQGRVTGHTPLPVSLHTSRQCSNWMRLTRRVNAVAGFIQLCVQSQVFSPNTFKQLHVLMFAIEYLGDIFSKYQTISCTNNQCSYQNVDPQPLLFMVTSGAEHKAGRKVWAGLGHGSQRQLIVHYISARGRVQCIKIWGTNFDKL